MDSPSDRPGGSRCRANRWYLAGRSFHPYLSGRVPFLSILFWLCIAAGGNASEVPAIDSGRGPLRARNLYPPHLMFLTPMPDTATMMPEGDWRLSLSVDYSSVFVDQQSDNWNALIDMEMAALSLTAEYGAAHWLHLTYELPFVSMSKGFLDGFLENYHNFFGLPNYGRENRPKNEFAYDLRNQGRQWLDGRPGGLHPTDSVLSAKIPLIRADASQRFSAGMVYSLKLPTGDYRYGFGSGGFDHGLSLLTKTDLFPFILYANGGVNLVSAPDTLGARVETQPVVAGFLGIEYLPANLWSLVIQVNAYTAPIKNTGIPQLDDPSVELGLGFIRDLNSSSTIEFAFCEDLVGRGAPDFNVHLRFSHHLE